MRCIVAVVLTRGSTLERNSGAARDALALGYSMVRRAGALTRRAALGVATIHLAACTQFVGRPLDASANDAADSSVRPACTSAESGAFRGLLTGVQHSPALTPFGLHLKAVATDEQGRAYLAGAANGCVTRGQFSAAVYRFKSSFERDPTFNADGHQCLDVDRHLASQYSAATTDARGRVLLAGSITEPSGLNFGLVVRLDEQGQLDATFADRGVLRFRPTLLAGAANDVVFYRIAVAGDGIVAAGSTRDPFDRGSAGVIAKFTADGALDTSFGDGGSVWVAEVDGFFAMRVDEEGLMLGATALGDNAVTIARYDLRGARRASFGENGVARHSRGRNTYVRSLGVDGAGRIYAVGGRAGTYNDLASIVSAVRFDREGHPDLSYGVDGVVSLPDYVFSIAYQRQDAAWVRCDGSMLVSVRRSNSTGAVLRLTDAGAIDADFANSGELSWPSALPAPNVCGTGFLFGARDRSNVMAFGGCSTNVSVSRASIDP